MRTFHCSPRLQRENTSRRVTRSLRSDSSCHEDGVFFYSEQTNADPLERWPVNELRARNWWLIVTDLTTGTLAYSPGKSECVFVPLRRFMTGVFEMVFLMDHNWGMPMIHNCIIHLPCISYLPRCLKTFHASMSQSLSISECEKVKNNGKTVSLTFFFYE